MTNMQPIPQVPGQNDRTDADALDAAGADDDVDQPLDPDLDDSSVDSAAADVQAATEGTLPDSAR